MKNETIQLIESTYLNGSNGSVEICRRNDGYIVGFELSLGTRYAKYGPYPTLAKARQWMDYHFFDGPNPNYK